MQVVVLLVACTLGIGLLKLVYGIPDKIYKEDDSSLDESETEYSDVSSTTPKRVTTADNDQEQQDSRATRISGPSCGPPRNVDKASVTGTTKKLYPVGSTVEYVCDFGFVADGVGKSSRCSLEGSDDKPDWTIPQITCIPRSCGDPGYVAHARRVGSLFTFPNKVSFECEEGYEIRGSSSRYCQTNGKWSGRLPTCILISCEPPQDIQNGRVTYSSLEYGSELEYECEKGYKLSNRQIRVCSASGTWTGDEPSCAEAYCENPVAPERGTLSIIGDKITTGSLARYSCDHGLVLRGSDVSKCLDTGEWTFPTPKCLDPCIVPQIWYGRIGIYEPRVGRRERYFKQIPVGTLLKGDESLFLYCDKGFKPEGISDYQVRVDCDRGGWSHSLGCESASCHQQPPETMNAYVSSVTYDHQSSVAYACNKGFSKLKTGNITCVYGVWKGITPVCTSDPCLFSALRFPGLLKPWKVTFKHGESFVPSCSNGYTVAKPQSSVLRCNHGEWNGHLPPCVAESCLNPPPSIPHGKVRNYGQLHASLANYECDEYFLLREDSKVTCLFGKWTGQLPNCIDSRCYAENLSQKKGVALEYIQVTYSGYQMDTRCFEGYHVGHRRPVCMNGQWTDPSLSPCVEDLCTVHFTRYGGITERKFVPGRFLWSQMVPVYNKVNVNSIPNRKAQLFVSCEDGYSVHGKGQNHVPVVCKEGKWIPNPICLKTGTPYQEDSVARQGFIMTTKAVQNRRTNSVTTEAILSTRAITTEEPPTSIDVRNEISEQDACYCVFPVKDKLLQAYVQNEQIDLGSKVLKGNTVKFHCSQVGTNRLIGDSELKCDDCREWHSSEVPSCVTPKKGDATIFFDSTFNVSHDGVLEIQKGRTGRLICVSKQVPFFPIWRIPDKSDVTVYSEKEVQQYGVFFVSVVTIGAAKSDNEGKYVCIGNSTQANPVELRVVDPDQLRIPCPFFQTNNEVKVEYNVPSEGTASFSCKRAGQKLVGKGILTCMKGGSWSDEPPKCIGVACPELIKSGNMEISYTDGFNVGSTAAFHCFMPGVRTGVPHTKCLENGQWKDEQPVCSLIRCSLETLFSVVPVGVTPSMKGVNNDTVPHGTTLRLMCQEGMAISGNPEAKCGDGGVWEVSSSDCVPGCLAFKKAADSRLMIEPEKELYTFGEFVTFSCPDGLIPTSEIEKIVCMSVGWSDSTVPDCVKQ